MEYKNLVIEHKDSVAILTINRPKVLNALSVETVNELDAAIDGLLGDTSVRGIIITGAGEKSFVAGADISELHNLDEPGAHEYARRGQKVFSKIENSRKPVLAAVNGFALGGGCELAMACHLRVASAKARFGQPEIKLGVIPG
jgi:enoyl-CoA hydratase